MFKLDLALNNLQRLIYNKIKPGEPQPPYQTRPLTAVTAVRPACPASA